MRLSSLLSIVGAAALVSALDPKDAPSDDADTPTVFDGVSVPPLMSLTPKNFDEVLNSTKYLFVKHYSPYCHHCKKFAPFFQTIYEYYTTEKTAGSLDTTADKYGLKFATINCVAYFDLCFQHDIQSYPTTVLYGDGKRIVDIKGVKNGTILSHHIEHAFDKDFPGERPAKVLLPKAGTAIRPLTEEEAGEILDKELIARMDREKAAKAKGAKAETPAKEEAPKASAAPKDTTPLLTSAGPTGDNAAAAAVAVGAVGGAAAGSAVDPVAAAAAPAAAAAAPAAAAAAPVAAAAEVPVVPAVPAAAAAAPAAAAPVVPAVADEKVLAKDALPAAQDSAAKDTKSSKKKILPPAPVYNGPPKSTAPQNPNGVSVPLTAETFQSRVTMSLDPWFIKFYAPWCHHCQAMAATWAQVAREMEGKINIGEVNCDKESRLCKDVGVRGYPTINLFRGGERVEYQGLRGLGDFVDYANKAVDIANGVQDVDAASFEALEAKNEVIFVYFYDFATTSEDFMALDRLPLSLIGHAKLVKTQDPKLYERYKITTWPRLIVSREGRPTYYAPLTPDEMRDNRRVLDWMRSVWLPIVPELTATNAREIMDGKVVVLGILKRDDPEAFAVATREMKSAASEWMDKQIQLFQLERQELRDAKQLRIEEAEDRNDQRALRAAKSIHVNMDRADRKEVTFAWVDGAFWQRWVRTTYGIDVKDGERVIINDEDNRRYWDITSTGNPILPSRTSILETLNKITAPTPKIKPKLTISAIEKVFFDIKMTFVEHPYLSTGCVLGMTLGVASWMRGRYRRTGGHFRLDDSISMKDFKLPMLNPGVSSNGKND